MTHQKRNTSLLWQFAMQRPLLLTVAIASRCVWEIIPVALPFLAGAIVDNLNGITRNEEAVGLEPVGEWSRHKFLLLCMFGLAAFAGLLAVLRSIAMAYAGRSLVSFARTQVAKKMLSSSGLNSTERSAGTWLGLLQRDCAMLRELLEKALVRSVTSILRLVGPIVGMFAISWSLTCILIATWILPLLAIRRLEKQLRLLTGELSTAQDRFTHTTKQVIDGREALSGCRAQGFALAMLNTTIGHIETIQLRIARKSAWVQSLLWFAAILAIALCWSFGAKQIEAKTLTLGQLIAFVGLLELAQRPVRSYARVARILQSTGVAQERLQSMLTEPEVENQCGDSVDEQRHRVDVGRDYRLCLESLSLRVGDRLIVDRLTHAFRSHSLTVVAGESGCGKSTLLRAIAGMIPIDEGSIKLRALGAHDVHGEIDPADILLVPQKPWVFDGTLRENVVAGLMDISEDQLNYAAKRSGVESFLAELPVGWKTPIGDSGVRLSGGQLLRVALCRAILRKPMVLLLDEPTAGLDANSEQLLLQQLRHLARDTLVIMAAHREACILAAADVLWLGSAKDLQESFENANRSRMVEMDARCGNDRLASIAGQVVS